MPNIPRQQERDEDQAVAELLKSWRSAREVWSVQFLIMLRCRVSQPTFAHLLARTQICDAVCATAVLCSPFEHPTKGAAALLVYSMLAMSCELAVISTGGVKEKGTLLGGNGLLLLCTFYTMCMWQLANPCGFADVTSWKPSPSFSRLKSYSTSLNCCYKSLIKSYSGLMADTG